MIDTRRVPIPADDLELLTESELRIFRRLSRVAPNAGIIDELKLAYDIGRAAGLRRADEIMKEYKHV